MVADSRRSPWPSLAARLLALTVVLLPAAALADGARSFKSGPIQVTADGSAAWLVNPDHDSVAVLETATGAWGITEHPLPDPAERHSPRGLSVKEDGSEIWVACHDSDRVYVLDGSDGSELARIDLPWGSGPYSVALSRPEPATGDQRWALVTLHRGAACALLDVTNRRLAHVLEPMYHAPLAVTWMSDGVTAWVTHVFADGEHPRLSRISIADPTDPKVLTRRRVFPTHPQTSSQLADPAEGAEGGYLTLRGHLAEVPNGGDMGRAWLTVQYRNIHQDIPTPDTLVQATIRKLDLLRRTIPDSNNNRDKIILSAQNVHDPVAGGAWQGDGWDVPLAGPVDLAFSADGALAWVLGENSENVVEVPVDTEPMKSAPTDALRTIDVGRRPMGLAASPTADLLFVLNVNDRNVSIIDTAGWVEVARVDVTPAVPEPVPPSLLNGQRLFHSSNDPRISSSRKVACASCHVNGEHDGTNWDLAYVGEAPCPGGGVPGVDVCQNGPGTRQTQTLIGLNVSFGGIDPVTGFGQLHHAGDRDEVQDFDHTFRGIQMGGTGFLQPADLHPPLDPNRNDSDPDLNDIAAYVLSLPPLARSPHREADGSLSEAAVRGATIFRGLTVDPARPANAYCASCHLPDAGFTDFGFHDVGQGYTQNQQTQRPGPPQENQLNNRTDPAHDWFVNTPSLVGLWVTPPYEGASSWAREDVLNLLDDFRSPTRALPHGHTSGLTNRQLRDLEEFVLSIDGDMTGSEVASAVDDAPPRLERVDVISPTLLSAWFNESVKPTAGDPALWRVTRVGGADVPVIGATFDAQNGDRLWLHLDALEIGCNPIDYRLSTRGTIEDLADTVDGGVANALDAADPVNSPLFTVTDTFTVSLGSSGYESLTIPVHDAATIRGLGSWSHGSIFIATDANGRNSSTGFVRFDWKTAIDAATGGALTSPDIVGFQLELQPSLGDSQELELRRLLKPWSDPGHGDWNSRLSGVPTWNENVKGSSPWGQPNARATSPGIDGTDPAHYNGAEDTADVPDLVATMPAINEPFIVSGPAVLDAGRFWFDNPSLDYGYALRITDGQFNETRFFSSQALLGLHSQVLRVTYRLPVTVPPPREVSAPGAAELLRVAKDPAGLRLSFEDLGVDARGYNVYRGSIGGWYSHVATACDQLPSLAGGRLEQVVPVIAGDRYFLVTASTSCEEGTGGFDWLRAERDRALLTCDASSR